MGLHSMRGLAPLTRPVVPISRVAQAVAALALASSGVWWPGAHAATTAWQEQPLEVVIDDVSYGGVWVCLPTPTQDGGVVLLERDFFQRVALTSNPHDLPEGAAQGCAGQAYVQPVGVAFKHDALNARLVGRLDAGTAFGVTRVEPTVADAPPKFEPTTNAALLNYSAYSTHSSFGNIAILDLGAQVFTGWGQLVAGGQYTQRMGESSVQWSNLLLRRDFFEQRMSLAIGRQTSVGLGSVLDIGATEFDGVVLSRRDTDDFDRTPAVLPMLRGYMPQPGTVTIRQSQRLVRVLKLPAGPFEVTDQALMAHMPAELELRGEGGELIEQVQVFVSGGLNLLQPGRTEWRVGVGRERLVGFLDTSNRSSSPSRVGLTASVRHGLSEVVTLEASARSSGYLGDAVGVAMVRELGAWGGMSMGVAMESESPERQSKLRPSVVLGYRISREGFSLDYRVRRNASSWASRESGGSGWEHAGSAGVTLPVGPGEFRGTLNAQSTPARSWSTLSPGGTTNWSGSVSGSYHWRMWGRVPVHAYVARTWSGLSGGPQTQVGIGFTLSTQFGPGHLTSQGWLESRRSSLRETYTIPVAEGVSASLNATVAREPDAGAALTWDRYNTQGWATVNHGSSGWSGSISARGAVAIHDGKFMQARPADAESSLAIIKLPELPNVALVTGGSTRTLARTNSNGYAALSGIEHRTALNYTVHGEEIPEGVRLPPSLVSGSLRRWSASVVEPRLRHVVAGSMRLVDTDGTPIAAGALIASNLSEETQVLALVDEQGAVFIDDIEGFPQRFYVFLAPDYGRTCLLTLPEDRSALATPAQPLTLRCDAR